MFRDLGRVHIVSFAVGIVGLIVGIVGIVLAIVFGTAQTTCTTPVTPTCPVITTQACNTNLFGISTTVNNMKWNDAYNNPNGAEYINAVNNITSTLTNSLNAGLNNQSSSSSFLRILAATGPTSNNVKVEITRLDKDGNGLVIAIGNGAISAAVPIENMPNATNVANVITADKNTYSNSTATPQVCPTCSECQPCTTPAYECPTCTPSPADCPTPTPTIGTTQTKPPTTTTTKPAPSTPALTSTRKTTTQETPITSTQFKFNSTTGPQTTTQKAPSSSLSPVPVPSTTQPKPTSAGSTSSTPKPQTSSPVPSTTTPTTTTPTTTTPTTTTPTTTTPTTTSPTTTSPTTTSPTTTSPSTTTPATTPTTTTPSTTTPTTTSPTTTIVTTPTTSTATTTTPTPTTTTTTPAQSTSTVPLSTTQGTTTVPPTIGPSQCYYQSNIAIAVELTSDDSPIDLKMQGFIYNNLLFYPGNPYQLGKRGSNMTELALVPYPTYTEIGSIMGYGAATTPQRISGLFNSSFPVFAGPDPEIYEALNFISNLTYDGNPGYVIIMGKNGSSVVKSLPSSELLQTLGFTVITIGYQSSDDFSLLASNPGLSFIINQDSDELVVARQIGNILNTSYCVPSSPSPGYITSSTLPVITSKSTPAPSTVTTTLPPSSSSPVPAPSSSPQPVPSSSIGTSSTSPAGTTGTTLPTTAPPTKAPGECYYQSNVAVAFELATSAEDIDLQIQNFITNDLFFYPGAPYDLGNITAGKTELSLVPYPNDDTLGNVMAYGFAWNPGQIGTAMEFFQQTAQQTPIISDAFKYIPLNKRTGAPGFVILVGNSDASAPAAVASAKNLQALGFKIITVAYKSAGSFIALSSDPSYNFQIHQDADKKSVAKAIGDILYAYACTTTVAPSSTVTVPQVSTSSPMAPKGSTSSSAPSTTVTNPTVPSTSIFQSSSTVSYTTTSGPTPTTCVCTTIEPGSTSPGYSTSTYATTMGSSSFSTASTPSMTSGSTPGASSSLSTQPSTPGGSTASSQSPGPSSSSPSPQTSTMGASTSSPSQQSSSAVTYTTATAPSGSTSSAASTSSPVASSTVTVPSTVPTSSGSTTSQICPNQQTVFDGSVGVIFELLPASAQQATINAFVENILLNSKYYGLAVDNLTNQNRTLATAIPYPSTDKYGVTGYGSARSLNDFKNEVIAFNGAIQPVTQTSHLSDALLYVANTLQSVTPKASLIIVGNSDSMIDNLAQFWADQLKANFTIYTVAVGDGATANLAPLSSGDGYSFTGNTQQIADQIGLKMATSNPAIYCPPPVPSTSAPITSTVSMSSTAPVSTTITSTTRLTTAKPTVGPCQCAGRWVYNGDMAIAFEFINGTDGSKQVTNFISNTLLKNPSSYGLSADVNGNQPSKLTIIPYPETNSYFLNPYGSIKQASDIGEFVDIYSGVRSTDTTPSIDDAFVYIKTLNTLNANAKVVLLVASDGSKVADAMDSANALKANGYTVITVAQTASADVFKPLASGDKYTLQIGTGNDDAVADQIANLLLDLSFVCYDDGSSTPAPTTRCPGTQGTTQPGSTGTTPVASSSSSMGSTVPSGTSSTMGSTVSSGSSSSMGSTVPSVSTSTMAGSSSSSAGSTVSVGSTVPTQSTSQGSSSSMGSTVSQGSTSTQPPASSSSSAGTITSTMGSTVTSASSTQGSSTLGSTVTSTMRPSVGPCDCQGRWVYNGDMAIAFEFIKDSSDSDKVTNFVSNTLLKDPSSYGLSADVNGNQPSQLTIVPYPNPDDYAAADSLPYGYFKNSTMIGNTINQYRVFQSDSTDPSIADALTYIGELTTGPNAKVVLLVAAEGTDVTPAMDSANALKANGYTVITVAQTASADVFKPLASGDKYSLQIGIGNDDAVAATIASLLLDISSVCYDDGSNTASPTTRCPGSQGTTLPGSTGTTSVAGSSSSMGSTVSSGSTSTMGSTVSSGSSSSPGSTVSSGSSSSMGSTASGSSSGSTASVGSTATTQSTSQGSSSSMGSTVSSGSTSTMAGSPSTSVGSTASVGSTVPTQSTSPGSSSSVGSTVSQGSTSTQPPASSASTITSTMGSTATSAPSTQGSSTSGSTAANTGSTSSPAQTSTMGSTVTSGPSTSPVPLCASPFNGKIAVVVEMNKTDTSIQLAEAFVKNNLYNSPNYNFADVTQAINLPYGSTDQYETNILKFGAAKSLADLQKNVDDLHNNAVASLPAVADGLGWIENNIDAPAAGSKTIVIVVGYSDDNNPGSTFFTKTDLQNAGYQFMSVSVGPGNLKDVADKPEWYFQVDQSNGQTIANQISYILCNL